jgi:nuclear transport factor 2 (NTF2) superfamily protein
METKPPLPPFTLETAKQKIQAAEDAWNSRDPERVSLAYTPDSEWRNRAEFISGRDAIKAFLQRKWAKELDYRLRKELWCFMENRIAVRFEYEWHDDSGHWYRSYGNENWEFAANGLMMRRYASINDLPIKEDDRKYHWERKEASIVTSWRTGARRSCSLGSSSGDLRRRDATTRPVPLQLSAAMTGAAQETVTSRTRSSCPLAFWLT